MTYKVWLSPTGSDASDGSQAAPVLTLARAQAILRAVAPDDDVEVRIAQGTYVAGQTTWDFYVPGHFVTFMPADYEVGEDVTGIAGRPVFRSNGSLGYWFVAKLPDNYSGSDLDARLRFYYLQVERYGKGGLMFYGRTAVVDGRRVPTTGVNGNTVWGMKFQEIGSAWGPEQGYGALSLNNSSGNYINANHFRYIENADPFESYIHGVYALHGSSNNTIRKNSFYRNSGDPVRIRNQSHDNDIHENTLTLTGIQAYSEWFCDQECVDENPGSVRECASQGNVFHHNTRVSAYNGGYLKLWALFPPDQNNAGPPGCPALTKPRLVTYGNT